MKFNRTQKVLTYILMVMIALQASMFLNTKPVEATNTLTWSEITPRQLGDPAYDGQYGTTPPLANNYLQYAGYKNSNNYNPMYTSIADLVETKPNGQKVYHFFVVLLHSYYYSPFSTYGGGIYHYTADNAEQKNWVKINPADFGNYGGVIHSSLKAIDQSWTDGNGSRWNKKLFMFCNTTNRIAAPYDYPYDSYYYNNYKMTLYRYDGNGSSAGWVNMVDPNSSVWSRAVYGKFYPSRYMRTFYAQKTHFEYVDNTNDNIDNGTIYLICPWVAGSNYSEGRWNMRVIRYTGTRNSTQDDLIDNPSPPTNTWDYVELKDNANAAVLYTMSWSNYQPVIFDTQVANNYIFISTCGPSVQSTEPHKQSPRLFFRYDTQTNQSMVPAGGMAPDGIIRSDPIWDPVRGLYYFNIQIATPGHPLSPYCNYYGFNFTGGEIYRAYFHYSGTPTLLYYHYSSQYNYSYSNTSYSSFYNWNVNFARQPGAASYAYQFKGTSFKIRAGTRNDTTKVFDLDAIVGDYYYGYYGLYGLCYGYANYDYYYRSQMFDVVPPPGPISMEIFNGYLYGGYPNGQLRRTNNFNDISVLDYNSWQLVSPITAINSNSLTRTMNNLPVTTLGKITKKNTLGQTVDVSLLVAGESQTYYYGVGEGVLYSTNGGGVPHNYTIVEDNWKYHDELNQGYGYTYGNTIYDIYDIYYSALGLITSFNSNRQRYTGGGNFHYRYFHIMNAKPTCKIEVNPDPVINERGTDSDVCFTFTPKGGFGSGNVQVYLSDFPINVYLPKKDVEGNIINTQISDSPLVIKSVVMNGSQITVCGVLRSTLSAVVGSYKLRVTIVDLETGWESNRLFTFMIVYPKPGFSERISPSTFDLYQGDPDADQLTSNLILKQYCNDQSSKSSQVVTVDIESRNEFEENVVVGLYWLTEPPSQDITAEWVDSPFIYDYIDPSTVEVVTRKNISTRYSFVVKVTPNTDVGVWKLKLFFLSGTIKHFKTVTINVLQAKPCLEITSIPKIIRVVPGANALYRIQVKSIDYDGNVALSLANVPPDVEVVQFHAENPPPGYADNYVELTSGSIAYAVLELRTYAITIDPYPPNNVRVTNMTDTKNVISWDGSKQGTNPVAGYEIWRGLSQYTDKAQQLGTVPATTTQFDDDNFDRTRTYYYFIRSFDNQTPPNYSEWAQSDPFKLAATEEEKSKLMASVIPHDGSAPGRFEVYVIGQGVSSDQQNAVCAVGTSILQIYAQMEDMATPFLNTWGWFIILLSMISVFYVVSKRVDLKKPVK